MNSQGRTLREQCRFPVAPACVPLAFAGAIA